VLKTNETLIENKLEHLFNLHNNDRKIWSIKRNEFWKKFFFKNIKMETNRTNEPILKKSNSLISFGTNDNAEKSKIDTRYSSSLNKFYRYDVILLF